MMRKKRLRGVTSHITLIPPKGLGRLVIMGCLFLWQISTFANGNGTMEKMAAAKAQQQAEESVSGTVLDKDGLSVPGVSILVKGTSRGTVSGTDGKFNLTVIQGETLVFSFIGMKTQEVLFTGQKKIDITMEDDYVGLDEVVAIGYGTVKKSDLTGAVATVDNEKLTEQPTPRLEHALQGRAPGVFVQRQGGSAAQDDIKIRVRGTNSITGNNEPLVVLDGFLGANLSDINPQDVLSMEVLSDASATAIYGSRGSNGVILITTKRGEKGKPKVTYNGSVGWDQVADKHDLFGAAEYMETINSVAEQQTGTPNMWFTDADIDEFRTGQKQGTDWQDAIYRTGFRQEHQVSLSGGSDRTKYFNSIGYSEMQGIVKKDEYQRFTLRSNTETKITDYITSTLNINYTRKISDRGDYGKLNNAYVFSPNLPIIDPVTGDYQQAGNYGAATAENPVQFIENTDIHAINNRFQGNLALDIKLFKGLSYRFFVGTTLNNVNTYKFERYDPGANPNTSAITQNGDSGYSWQINNQLTYQLESGIHNLSVTAVQEAAKSEQMKGEYFNTSLISNSLSYYQIGLGSSPTVNSAYIGTSLASYLGRANYTLADKYLISVSMRADGASKFAPGNKWAYFPSGAVAWQVHKENFYGPLLNVMSTFKIRASLGQVGSQAIAPYATRDLVLTQNASIDGKGVTNAAVLNSPANPDLQWETTTQSNIGFNAAFFNGRLTLDFDYYYKRTTDLLYNTPQPYYTGLFRDKWNSPPEQMRNIGEMENQGYTIDLNGVIVNSNDWHVSLGGNFSYNANKFLGFTGSMADVDKFALTQYAGSSMNGINVFWLVPGQPMADIYGLQYLGTWKESQAAEAAQFNDQPGDPRYVDANGDHKYDNEDAVKLGSGMPKYNVGINLNASYRNFDLTALFQGALGFDILNLDTYNTRVKQTSTDIRNRYTAQNESDIWVLPSNNWTAGSSEFLESGDYLRLNNLSIGYTLPEGVISKVGIGSCRFFVNGQNLFTISKFSGLDPGATSTGSSDLQQGVANGVYPIPRTFTMGVNLTF